MKSVLLTMNKIKVKIEVVSRRTNADNSCLFRIISSSSWSTRVIAPEIDYATQLNRRLMRRAIDDLPCLVYSLRDNQLQPIQFNPIFQNLLTTNSKLKLNKHTLNSHKSRHYESKLFWNHCEHNNVSQAKDCIQ